MGFGRVIQLPQRDDVVPHRRLKRGGLVDRLPEFASRDHLSELLSDPPEITDARWLDELQRSCIELHDRIQHHVVDEEDQLFRLADRHLTPEDDEILAVAFKKIQSRA